MIGNNLWSEKSRALLLHLLGQDVPHGIAEIRGSPAALRRLAEACEKAADAGQSQIPPIEIEMMTSDGEHYPLCIYAMSDRQMDQSPLPYEWAKE